MMKNITKIFIFFIIGLYNMGIYSHAFIGEEPGLNLYSIIDEGLEEIDNQNFYYELSGTEDSITDKVNEIIKQHYNIESCISGDLAPSHIYDISAGNLQTLTEKLGDNCKNSSGSYDINQISDIQKTITEHYKKSQLLAQEKTEQIQKIGSVGIYSDGILENGSFDLIEDLKNIDKIIFHEETVYEGEEYEDIDEFFQEKQSEKRQINLNNATDPEVRQEIIQVDPNYTNVLEIDNITNINILKSIVNEPFSFGGGNNYVCKEGFENHGFNPEIIETLTGENIDEDGDINNPENNYGNGNNENGGNQNSSENTGNDNNTQVSTQNIGTYKSVNDNGAWPCNNFFCISVEFVMNDQPLFGGTQDVTIEYLIDRSNQHLKKFKNSFLGQSKMTIGNFELGLKDLDLSEMFHMSFQVQTKPVPILKLEKEDSSEESESQGENDNSEYSANTLLEKYYKAYNLDYKRKNDITQFLQQDKELKTMINSTDLAITEFVEKRNELKTFLADKTNEAETINKSIHSKLSYETLGDFEQQFIELNNFTSSIAKYTEDLGDVIIAMTKIPIDG